MPIILPTIRTYFNNEANNLVLHYPGLTIWYSYQTIIGFQEQGQPPVTRKNEWQQTTGKHLNAIDGGDKAARLDGEDFQAELTAALARHS